MSKQKQKELCSGSAALPGGLSYSRGRLSAACCESVCVFCLYFSLCVTLKANSPVSLFCNHFSPLHVGYLTVCLPEMYNLFECINLLIPF